MRTFLMRLCIILVLALVSMNYVQAQYTEEEATPKYVKVKRMGQYRTRKVAHLFQRGKTHIDANINVYKIPYNRESSTRKRSLRN